MHIVKLYIIMFSLLYHNSVTLVDTLSNVDIVNDSPFDIPIERKVLINTK